MPAIDNKRMTPSDVPTSPSPSSALAVMLTQVDECETEPPGPAPVAAKGGPAPTTPTMHQLRDHHLALLSEAQAKAGVPDADLQPTLPLLADRMMMMYDPSVW